MFFEVSLLFYLKDDLRSLIEDNAGWKVFRTP